MNRVRVLLFNSAIGPLDYSVPAGMELPAGSVVQVPLGPRRIDGIVWDAGALDATEVEASRLRRSRPGTTSRPCPRRFAA